VRDAEDQNEQYHACKFDMVTCTMELADQKDKCPIPPP
jgi:hypothetical protein